MQPQPIKSKLPLDYIKLVFRRKWLIIIPTVIGIIGGIISVNIIPKKFESSTLILVEEGRVINPLIQGLAVSTSVAQRLTVLREQIAGWDRINQLIKKLDLAKDVKTQQEFEDLVLRLRKSIMVKLHGTNIIRISYIGNNPSSSMNVVKNIADIFIDENLKQQSRETDNAIAFINDQLALYQKKLKQGEIAAMEDKLDTLLVDSTERHPMVMNLKKKIAIARGEMEKGDYDLDKSSLTGNAAETAALKEELVGLKQELTSSVYNTGTGAGNREKLSEATNEKLYKMLLLERVDKVTNRDATVNQTLYDELLKRLETAKMTQRLEASRDGTRYTVLDPARMPLSPVKPNKLMVLLMGMLMGLGAGLCLVAVVEVFDHSLIDPEEAGMHLDLPLLGAIPKIVTLSDIRIQKIRNIKIAFLSISTAIVLIIAIIYNVLLGG